MTYVLWGLLHLQAARLVCQTLEPGIVQGRIYQDAWNLLFFALFGIIVAVFLNWKNSRLGYWLIGVSPSLDYPLYLVLWLWVSGLQGDVVVPYRVKDNGIL